MSAIGQFHSLLGTVRIARFRLRHHRASLDKAIRHLESAVTRLPRDHPDRPLNLATLGNGRYWRYELAADPADLDAAIDRLAEAAASPGVPEKERATYRGDLAAVLRARFVRDGHLTDLDDAIAAATDAIEHGDDPAGPITNRAVALVARYEFTADVGDLLAALADARLPVGGRIATALHGGLRLAALVDALSSRYRYTDDPDDLAGAIEAGRRALATLSWTDPYRWHYAAALSTVLRLSDQEADHDEAVTAAEEALRGGQADRAYLLSTLSAALLRRNRDTGDLQRARETQAEALELANDVARPFHLERLSRLERRWSDRHPAELEEAIRAAREDLPAGRPMRAALACELAELMLRRGAPAEAVDLLAGTVREANGSLRAAARLGPLAAEDGDTANALLGYRRAVELLPAAAWPGLRRAVREARLAEAPAATDAAAVAVLSGDAKLAVELLESGRSVLWSQQLNLRTDLAALEAVAPTRAARLTAIRGWFERPTPA